MTEPNTSEPKMAAFRVVTFGRYGEVFVVVVAHSIAEAARLATDHMKDVHIDGIAYIGTVVP